MKTFSDKQFDLAIVDPPYGLGDRLFKGGGKYDNTNLGKYNGKSWDIVPTKEYWDQLFRVSKNQIVFGANFFIEYLHNSRGIIFWDKRYRAQTLSNGEFIWTSFDFPVKIFSKRTPTDKIHPVQKPYEIYEFCLYYAKVKNGDKILDTFLGSGTIAHAIDRLSKIDNINVDFTGIELDSDYFNSAIQKFNNSREPAGFNFSLDCP
jgi:site-specific DNA-methyltransferase (adenine-specific)